ncbi:MAG: hypothetical protein FWG70_03955 [Oscillospiraceae bacterium]|nr:hypothetical protein [Oscillospiraceae bacterium]
MQKNLKKARSSYDISASVFNSVMSRESEIVKDYYTNEEFRVFFRNKKNTSSQGFKTELYYYAGENIKAGTLIKINDKTYLAINCGTAENTLYKRSDLFECNIIMKFFNNGQNLTIPGFSYSLTSVFGDSFPRISSVSGNMQILTQDNDTARKVSIGTIIQALDCHWLVNGRILQNGLIKLYVKKQSENPSFTLEHKFSEGVIF